MFTRPGTYIITPMVTDSRGTQAFATYRFAVRKPSAYTPLPPTVTVAAISKT